MCRRLTDRVAIVTGGASGIGLATVVRLAAEGAQVVAIDRSSEALTQIPHNNAINILNADISDEESCRLAIDTAVSSCGGLDILVNNVGLGGGATVEDTTFEAWDTWLALNLRTTFAMSRHALPHLRESGGTIVNVASTLGLRGFPGQAAYTAAKAGVIGLTRQMAADLGSAVRVNAVAPGVVRTPATERRLADSAAYRAVTIDATPMGRPGAPNEIAAAIAFLASDDASYVSGHVLVVDGGASSSCIRTP